MVLIDQVVLSVITRVDDVLTNHFITPYQKLDCVFHDSGFVIHWSSINVTANLVGFLETIVLSTKNGYEDLTIGTIHHEELKDMKNLYLIKWLFIHFKIITQSTKIMKRKSEMKQIIENWYWIEL